MEISSAFAALGNPTRLAIIERLLRDGEAAAGDLAQPDVSAPGMSHHFKVLREAGIVNQRVDAQRRLYSVRPEAMRAIGRWTLTYREFWDGGLDRLAAALAGSEALDAEPEAPRAIASHPRKQDRKGNA